jgi:hypothetical protein
MARILTERRSCNAGVPCRTSSCGPCSWRRPGQRGSGQRGGRGGGRKQSSQQGRCWRRREEETYNSTMWQAYPEDSDLVCMARWLRVVAVVQASGFRVSGGRLALLLLLLLLPRMRSVSGSGKQVSRAQVRGRGFSLPQRGQCRTGPHSHCLAPPPAVPQPYPPPQPDSISTQHSTVNGQCFKVAPSASGLAYTSRILKTEFR